MESLPIEMAFVEGFLQPIALLTEYTEPENRVWFNFYELTRHAEPEEAMRQEILSMFEENDAEGEEAQAVEQLVEYIKTGFYLYHHGNWRKGIQTGLDKWMGAGFLSIVKDDRVREGANTDFLSKRFVNAVDHMFRGATIELYSVPDPVKERLAAQAGNARYDSFIFSGRGRHFLLNLSIQ